MVTEGSHPSLNPRTLMATTADGQSRVMPCAGTMGELIVGTSAVIAVVVMGLYINEHKSALSPEVLHYMHQFYEMIAHILNTVTHPTTVIVIPIPR